MTDQFLKYSQRMAIALLFAIFSGCASFDWQQATKSDTVHSYTMFLSKHGDSEFAQEAKSRREIRSYEEAVSKNAIPSYVVFLENYPKSEFAIDVRIRLDDLRALKEERHFQQAKKSDTVEAVRDFLRRYPTSARKADLLKRFAIVEADLSPKIASVDPYRKPGYYPLSGPVWVYRVTFLEKNGIGAELTSCELRIPDVTYGSYKTGQSDHIDRIRIDSHGAASYESWVRGEGLRGKSLGLYFKGKDDNGHPVQIHVRSYLE